MRSMEQARLTNLVQYAALQGTVLALIVPRGWCLDEMQRSAGMMFGTRTAFWDKHEYGVLVRR